MSQKVGAGGNVGGVIPSPGTSGGESGAELVFLSFKGVDWKEKSGNVIWEGY